MGMGGGVKTGIVKEEVIKQVDKWLKYLLHLVHKRYTMQKRNKNRNSRSRDYCTGHWNKDLRRSPTKCCYNGVETWQLIEMELWRRMEGVTRKERMTNEAVLRRTREGRQTIRG